MDSDLHRDLAAAAQREGTSINALIVAAIEEKLERPAGARRHTSDVA
jgi:predicted HicB family RNase H-like nuclease